MTNGPNHGSSSSEWTGLNLLYVAFEKFGWQGGGPAVTERFADSDGSGRETARLKTRSKLLIHYRAQGVFILFWWPGRPCRTCRTCCFACRGFVVSYRAVTPQAAVERGGSPQIAYGRQLTDFSTASSL